LFAGQSQVIALRPYTRDTAGRGARVLPGGRLAGNSSCRKNAGRSGFAIFNMHRSHILDTSLPVPRGILKPSRSSINLGVWYGHCRIRGWLRSARELTSDLRNCSISTQLPAGSMPDAARDDLVRSCRRNSSPAIATAVSAEKIRAFITRPYSTMAGADDGDQPLMLGDGRLSLFAPIRRWGFQCRGGRATRALRLSYCACLQADDLANCRLARVWMRPRRRQGKREIGQI